MNDDQMDELLIQGVRDYNAPSAVPRDEMWTQIQRTRLEKKNATVSPVSVTEIRESRWWMRNGDWCRGRADPGSGYRHRLVPRAADSFHGGHSGDDSDPFGRGSEADD